MKYNLDIPGWMSPTDLEVLSTLASFVPENGKILEVGCFVGRSTTALFTGKPTSATLEIIDTFEINNKFPVGIDKWPIGGHKEQISKIKELAESTGSWFEAFKHCMTPRVVDQIKINVMSSQQYTLTESFDMVFIDANHTEVNVILDILKFGNNTTLLVGDDFGPRWPGVTNALHSLRKKFPGKLIIPENSKIWIMVPTEGYWKEFFQKNILF